MPTIRAKEDLRQSATESAWRLLAYRRRSRHELQQRLLRKGYPAEIVEPVLDRLTELGYLDDQGFAQSLVETRQIGRSPRSKSALMSELRRKGIESESAAIAVADIDDLEAARRAVAKQAGRLAAADHTEFRRRLAPFLQRRGFSYDTIRATVEALWQERGQVLPDDDVE